MQKSVITRLAILISSPGPEENYLPGSVNDPEHMARYLMSPRGGMWRANEIFCLADPSWEDIDLLLQFYITDYLFVYFSGHGFMTYDQKRYFCFKNASVEDTALFNDSSRQLVIGDACREYLPTISGIPEEEEFIDYIGDGRAREAFDQAIINSPSGKMIVHSTQAGELAYERNGQGGVFTIALLSTARNYRTGDPFLAVPISALIPGAQKLLSKGKYKQQPDIAYCDGNLQVPFLIDTVQNGSTGQSAFNLPAITTSKHRTASNSLKILAAGLIAGGIMGLFDD
jgi:hypothetical protein